MTRSGNHPALWALLILVVICAILAILLLKVNRERARRIYREQFGSDVPRERLLLASIGFYVGFAGIRALTHAIRAGRGPFHNVAVGGRHIHHLVWGILLLLLVGYCWLWQVSKEDRFLGRLLSFAYGLGAALTLDEFALWLNLRDVYWEREGRASIDAILLFSALLGMGIFGGRFVRALSREAFNKRRGIALQRGNV
ncbi:MAG: hypothetical protein M3Z32_06675 [Acidobacteriota bacterium]|nr:hypothetical protein [Acidobacteriota bacterium]